MTVNLHVVYPGGIDTDMLANIAAPKTESRVVAAAILRCKRGIRGRSPRRSAALGS
jgi:hypothetical protein